jgi:hypothetical protein
VGGEHDGDFGCVCGCRDEVVDILVGIEISRVERERTELEVGSGARLGDLVRSGRGSGLETRRNEDDGCGAPLGEAFPSVLREGQDAVGSSGDAPVPKLRAKPARARGP